MATRGRKLQISPASRRCPALKLLSSYFPLNSRNLIVELFREQICQSSNPDLAVLSLILGAVEHGLTFDTPPVNASVASTNQLSFPVIQLNLVEQLYEKFSTLLRDAISTDELASCRPPAYSTRAVVRKVSDVVWSYLHSSYQKDRAHMQSLYSLLNENKLDCFGVATCVIAACQLLGLDDVHLAMTEDHVWVVFGENGQETAEVTWHGKGIEDKRGQPVSAGVACKSWLYLNGHAVICTRHMELAAMVSSINPSISSTSHSAELAAIQQQLLWLLYDAGHIDRYPIIINQLGDLCELNASPDCPPPLVLYKKAIESAQVNYANMHVYPYTYLGHYYYRNRHFKEALASWADASDVISKYNYGRDDEEVYKEFFEIANMIIPQILRMEQDSRSRTGLSSLLNDAHAFALLLRFYDGICLWEEDSNTPVLHITWATHMISSVSKFDSKARSRVCIVDSCSPGQTGNEQMLSDVAENNLVRKFDLNGNEKSGISGPKREVELRTRRIEVRARRSCNLSTASESGSSDTNGIKLTGQEEISSSMNLDGHEIKAETHSPFCESACTTDLSKSGKDTTDVKLNINIMSSAVGKCPESDDDNEERNKEIAALAHGCCDKLLNPDFLLGSGEPFFKEQPHQLISMVSNTQMDLSVFAGACVDSESMAFAKVGDEPDELLAALPILEFSSDDLEELPRKNNHISFLKCQLLLRSTKMRELKNLLVAPKLNNNAITLQLTAQSQVHLKHRGSANDRKDRKRQKIN